MATDLPAAYDTWRRGALTLSEYARSLRGPVELATFAADDPLPALVGPLRFAAPLTRRAV
jgi:predicted ATP-grasp superfamily ATP-dependent carboligase